MKYVLRYQYCDMFYAIDIAVCFYAIDKLGNSHLIVVEGFVHPCDRGSCVVGGNTSCQALQKQIGSKSPFSIRMVPVHQISSLHTTFLVLHWENLVPGRFFGITSVEVSNELKE